MFLNDKDMATEFAGMLVCHMDKSAWPGFDDQKKVARIRRMAKKNGFADKVAKHASPEAPILCPVKYNDIKSHTFASLLTQFGRTDSAISARWLKHPDVSIALVEDLLWSFCETSTRTDEQSWCFMGTDHRGSPGLQLTSSRIALRLAEGLYLLRDELDDTVKERVKQTLYERALLPGTDWRRFNWWHWGRNNQNTVNVGNLIGAGLYLIDDVYQLGSFLMPLVNNLAYTLDGFTEDGGCTEGIDYWNYGFKHFVMAAIMLKHRTGGDLNLMTKTPKIERICRYPLSVYIEDKVRACWADSFYGYIEPRHALMINEFFDIPELYACCPPEFEKAPMGLHTMSLYKGQKHRQMIFPDAFLPDLGTAKLHVGDGSKRVGLAVQGGNNGVHHNHNDIGSFIFYKDGVPVLTDPGYPDYAAVKGNFDTKLRYQCVYNNTFGHSAPIINGQGQPSGPEYRGKISVDGLDGPGAKTVELDLTAAYDVKSLKNLNRTYHVTIDGNLDLTDSYTFTRKPKDLYEQFITYEKARVVGNKVRITSGKKQFTLSCNTAGAFRVEVLTEDSKLSRKQGVINRIRFFPKELQSTMALRFHVSAWSKQA